MKYIKNDLENIIAICALEDDSKIAERLSARCMKALAYRDVSIRLTKEDRRFLAAHYGEDIDPDAKQSLDKILGL